MRDDELIVQRALRQETSAELWRLYREFDQHVRAMERPNNYQFLEESYEYAKLRRDDFRQELRRRGLA